VALLEQQGNLLAAAVVARFAEDADVDPVVDWHLGFDPLAICTWLPGPILEDNLVAAVREFSVDGFHRVVRRG